MATAITHEFNGSDLTMDVSGIIKLSQKKKLKKLEQADDPDEILSNKALGLYIASTRPDLLIRVQLPDPTSLKGPKALARLVEIANSSSDIQYPSWNPICATTS